MINLKKNQLKLFSAGLLAFSALASLVTPVTANAALISGTASISINNTAVSTSNAGGWFFEKFWGADDNTLALDGDTTGGIALSTTGTTTLYTIVNSNNTTISYPTAGAYGRTVQATTMNSSDTSTGQIGLSGGLRMRDSGLSTYLAPYDFSLSKDVIGDWFIKTTDTGFGTVNLFKLGGVSESLDTNGNLLLSGDLYWATGFGYASLIGADTSTVLGNFELAPSAVPVPAALWLFSGALVSLIGIGRKKTAVAV